MKRIRNKVISAGLVGVSVLTPLMNSNISVLAMETSAKNDNSQFSWVKGHNHESKIELLNNSSNNFWFFDDISKTIYARGNTFINFLVNEETLKSPLKSIEILSAEGESLKKVDNENNLKVSLEKVTLDSKVLYTFEDGSIDEVALNKYFSSISGGIEGIKVDSENPDFIFENKDTSKGVFYNDKYFKGKLIYTFQSDIIAETLPNIWGTTGYKYKLLINGEDYTDSRVFKVNYDKSTGKTNIEVNLDNILQSYAGNYKIEISVYDNVGNESKYVDNVFVDYEAPKVEGTILENKWLDTSSNITYFNSSDTVKVNYNVSDIESGVKNVSILKNSVVINDNAEAKGSFTINSEAYYKIRVEDNLGNTKIYNLSDMVEGVSDKIIFDTNKPEISCSEEGIVNTNWFAKGSFLSLDISDDIGIDTIKYIINNKEEVVNLGGSSKSYNIKVDYTSIVEDSNELSIGIIVKDMLGNETTYSKLYNADISSPKLSSAEVDKEISVIDGVGYAKGPVKLSGEVIDIGSGIATVDILKDGVSVSNELPYTIKSDGSYSVKLVDMVGNETILNLNDIVGKDFSNIVIDDTAPEIEALIDGVDISDNWYKDSATLILKANDNKNIKSIKYSINGVETVLDINDKNYELNLKLDDLVDSRGLIDFKCYVTDIIGNESSYSKVIKLDKSSPIIENARLDGNVFTVGDTIFIKDKVKLLADVSDSESGVSKIEILNGVNVVGESLPFEIIDSGLYSIRVTDGSGHVITKNLSELLFLDTNDIVVDSDAPNIVSSVYGNTVDTWYKDKANLLIQAEDISNIKSIRYSINDGDFVEKNDINRQTYDLSLDLKDYIGDGGKVKVLFEAIDSLGNKATYNKEFNIDISNPSISNGKLEGSLNIIGTTGYVNGALVLSADISDNESGVSKVEVFKDKRLVATSLPYSIVDSGSYSVKVTDGVGHITLKTLKELTGLEIDNLIVNNYKPEITRLEGFTADYVKDDIKWYKNAPSFKISVEGRYLDSISIKVNDTEVINEISEDGIYSIPIDNAEGSYKIETTVIDKAQNVTIDTYAFNVDYSKPILESGSIEGDYTTRDFGLFFAEEPKLVVSGSDNGIGIRDYVLLNSEGVEVSKNQNGVFTLESGEYFVKLVDYFGNESEIISVKDLCDLDSNKFIIDNVAPVILANRPEGGLDGWFDSIVSYDILLTDSAGINKAKVLVNDKVVDEFIADADDITKVSLVADISKVFNGDGTYNVSVIVEDNTGLSSEWSDSVNIDISAPEFVDGAILGNYVDRGDSIVFASSPSLKVSANDKGIGLKSITLMDKEGNIVPSVDGLFTLSSNEYFLVFEDMIGNKTDLIPINEVLNLPSNSIVIDESNPSINVSRQEGVWFKDDIIYSLSLKDDCGLGSVKVSINGSEVVNSVFEEKSITTKDISFSTENITPNEDGSYNVSIEVSDIVGNVSNWNDIVYIDKDAPVIDRFIVTGEGYLEGDEINSSDKYGFYIKGKTDIEIHISDGNFSSGLDKLYYELISDDGSKEQGVSDISNGVAKVSIDKDFKGYISAYATDNVGNVGSSNRPDGIISESGNTHINTSRVDIQLPETVHTDNKGNYLYNGDVSVKAIISDSFSGLKEVSWGVNEETKGTVYIDNNGNLSGDDGIILNKDKNLIVDFSKDFIISGNSNDMTVWVEATDRVGNKSKNIRNLSIDKDAPIINVTYDSSKSNSVYNTNRVATISIKDRNFRSGDVKFSGVYGSVGEWNNVGDDTWVCNVVFSEDKDYEWSIDYSDMAGNIGNHYSSEKFTIDKTAPVLNVSFDNNSVESGNFYKNTRVASISVLERNFDPSSVVYEGNGTLGSWSSNGDLHTANVVFDTDGEYEFSVSMSDKAGNTSTKVSSNKFIIDKTVPSLSISGVQDGVSYKKNVGFKVNISDANIDVDRCSVTLSGRSIGNVGLIGGINGTNGEFTFTGVPEDIKYDDLYTLKAVIYDKAGNCVEKVINYSINRFGSRFSFLDTSILNKVINEPESVTLEEVSVDKLDISSCKVVVIRDGKVVSVDSKYIKIEETGGSDTNWVYKYHVDKKAFDEDGKYQVQIFSKASDGTENSSLSQEYFFVLDTNKPEIIISGVESGSSYKDVSRKVAIEIRDLSGISYIKAFLNGKEVALSEEGGLYYITIPEDSKKQSLTVKATDKAGNTSTVQVENFLVSSNIVSSVINSSIIKGILSGVGVALLFLIGLLLKRRKASKKEERELAQEHAKMYHDSITGTSTNSDSNSNSDK